MIKILEIVRCANCGAQHGKEKYIAFPFNLVWAHKAKCCNKCHEIKRYERSYDFCSEKCLKEWVNKFFVHKHDWDYNMASVSTETVKGKEKYIVYPKCKVCGLKSDGQVVTKEKLKELFKYDIDYLKMIYLQDSALKKMMKKKSKIKQKKKIL